MHKYAGGCRPKSEIAPTATALVLSPGPSATYPLPELDAGTERQVYERFSATMAANTVAPDLRVWEALIRSTIGQSPFGDLCCGDYTYQLGPDSTT
jgi:hypothetical protein